MQWDALFSMNLIQVNIQVIEKWKKQG